MFPAIAWLCMELLINLVYGKQAETAGLSSWINQRMGICFNIYMYLKKLIKAPFWIWSKSQLNGWINKNTCMPPHHGASSRLFLRLWLGCSSDGLNLRALHPPPAASCCLLPGLLITPDAQGSRTGDGWQPRRTWWTIIKLLMLICFSCFYFFLNVF